MNAIDYYIFHFQGIDLAHIPTASERVIPLAWWFRSAGIFTQHASSSLLSKVWRDIQLSHMKFQNNLDFVRSWLAVAFSNIPRPLCCHDTLLYISTYWHKRCSKARPEPGPRTRRLLAKLRMRQEHTSLSRRRVLSHDHHKCYRSIPLKAYFK